MLKYKDWYIVQQQATCDLPGASCSPHALWPPSCSASICQQNGNAVSGLSGENWEMFKDRDENGLSFKAFNSYSHHSNIEF